MGRMGAVNMDYKPLGVKVAVGKVINMTYFPFLSLNTLARISFSSVEFKQSFHHRTEGWSQNYRVRVAYPNGYGASIIAWPEGSNRWEVALLKDDILWEDDEGYDCVWSDLTEEEVIQVCDRISSY